MDSLHILMLVVMLLGTTDLVTSQLLITVTEGQLLGKLTNLSHSSVVSFLGVPYASPPVGPLRFKKPYPAKKWLGIRHATDFQSNCQQNGDYSNPYNLEMSEDCLYLNIYVPEFRPHSNFRSPNFTVLVYFHPGNFLSGSGSMLDGRNIAIHNSVIVVTVNFRLGLFGFLSLDNTLAGNYGLLDQAFALQWIKNNIEAVGGDPANIVLMCDHFTARLHLLSSSSFHYNKIVSYKKSNLNVVSKVGRSADILKNSAFNSYCARHYNSPPGEQDNVRRCLKNMNGDLMLQTFASLETSWNMTMFGPVVDGMFLKYFPGQLLGWKRFHLADYLVLDVDGAHVISSTRSTDDEILHCGLDSFQNVSNVIARAVVLSGNYVNYANDVLQTTFHSFYYPQKPSSKSFCEQTHKLIEDYSLSELLNFIDVYSNSRFTFLAVVNGDSKRHNGSKPHDLHCALYPANCSSEFGSINSLLESFFSDGYPHTKGGQSWRPYTPTNKNFLLLGNESITQGNKGTWPYEKHDLLWKSLLPKLILNSTQLYQNHLQAMIGGAAEALPTYAETEWGMGQSQLEALIVSLILIVLFLLMVTIAMFRIICFVKGKPFYDETKIERPRRRLNGQMQERVSRAMQEQFTESSGISSISEF